MLELRRFAFVLVLVLGACSSSSSVSDDDGSSGGGGTVEPPPEDPAPTFACPAGAAEAFASMAAAFEAQLTENGVPGGAVAMLCGGEVQHVATHGVAFAGGPPITADTRFQWASTTKMFTGALAVALAEDGVVDLHAEVGTIAAALGYPGVTLHHLLSHTAAYPKPVDVVTHHTLPDFIRNRGGVSLRPGDGVIHSWLNRMLLPDTVGTGGDSHTRFPIGISFPAGSGLVAFGAATGVIPLDMPESVLVRFKGTMQPGITLRDLVNAIPYKAIQTGDLTVAKAGKKNIFSGRILEVSGVRSVECRQQLWGQCSPTPRAAVEIAIATVCVRRAC